MTTKSREEKAPLSPADEYNAAVQLHNQEFRALGERTTAFLIAQSILVAAFVHILTGRGHFPIAFEVIALGIIVIGILYCVLHYLAGQSGSQAAFRWRQYMMRHIENNDQDAPWNWFYDHCEHTHEGERHRNILARLLCEKCLLKRRPLPTAWLISPAIFFMAWIAAIISIIWKLGLPLPCTIALTVLFAAGALYSILWRWKVWWHHQENNR